LALTLFIILTFTSFGQVEVNQQELTLPTYGVREPEIMPDWRASRYPYAMMDRLTNEKGSRTYNALYVENEYVSALVLPELGGRLHGATDKTNGYGFLYDQKVIKPGLVSLTGAWISGGVEWNFPSGHRASGFRDTDWTLRENKDGSKSVWVGEIERLKRMRWSVGTTVYPGRNWVETRVRLENCTPFIQSFQYWATSAVRATQNYQAVIPGEIVTGHGKHEFFHWPVHEGVDMTYWKNIPGASSFFAVDSESDYFGGYSPEEQAGMVHFADHHIVRGKKLWTWGTAPAGRLWEEILADGDLPYFEPQAGAYSDNQPSLFWIMPGETKVFSHFWFPVRDIGVYDYANLEGAVNLELKDGKVFCGWSPTAAYKGAKIIVYYDGKEVLNDTKDADPANPYRGTASIEDNADLYKLKMTIHSATGGQLMTFSHLKPENPALPQGAEAPPAPEKVQSQDKLYLFGDRFYRYNNPEKAETYFREALQRDPGDLRSNTALGEMALKNGLYQTALDHFNISLERDESYFKVWYYKGLTQIRLECLEGAEESLNRATYSLGWNAIAHFELAQLAAQQNRMDNALRHINLSIKSNGNNSQAHAVKALILVRMEKYKEALEVTGANLTADPLDFFSKQVELMAKSGLGAGNPEMDQLRKELMDLTRTDTENHIELAIRLARCGNHAEAIQVLQAVATKANRAFGTPLVSYYQAYYHSLLSQPGLAGLLLKKATTVDPAYCFPYRLETFPVLEWALSEDPDDAMAHYLMGSLLRKCERLDEATEQWERSVVLDPSNAVAWRNLGLVYHDREEMQKAKDAYEAAVKANPNAGRAIVELGMLNRALEIPVEEQIEFFESYLEVVATYNTAVSQLVELYIHSGRNLDALKWLNNTHFNSWEGQYGIHQLWLQGNIKQGDAEFDQGNYENALSYYQQSLLYPANLEVAEQPNTIHARKKYLIGNALLAMGKKREARKYFEAVIADRVEDRNAYQYYRGKAMEATGKKQEARLIYEKMLEALGDEWTGTGQSGPREKRRESVWMYSRGLALKGLGNEKEAESLINQAIELNPQVELIAFRPPRSGF